MGEGQGVLHFLGGYGYKSSHSPLCSLTHSLTQKHARTHAHTPALLMRLPTHSEAHRQTDMEHIHPPSLTFTRRGTAPSKGSPPYFTSVTSIATSPFPSPPLPARPWCESSSLRVEGGRHRRRRRARRAWSVWNPARRSSRRRRATCRMCWGCVEGVGDGVGG